jgi:ABC-type branched-subunit amino acid transport system ATPase component
MSAFLKVSDMEFAYGEVTVLRGLDLEVEEGTISCVMGRNGVGQNHFFTECGGLGKILRGQCVDGWNRYYSNGGV